MRLSAVRAEDGEEPKRRRNAIVNAGRLPYPTRAATSVTV